MISRVATEITIIPLNNVAIVYFPGYTRHRIVHTSTDNSLSEVFPDTRHRTLPKKVRHDWQVGYLTETEYVHSKETCGWLSLYSTYNFNISPCLYSAPQPVI